MKKTVGVKGFFFSQKNEFMTTDNEALTLPVIHKVINFC